MEKGQLDRTISILTLAATIAIAMVGFMFTVHEQQGRETQNTLDSLVKALQMNTSANPAEQRAGNALLGLMRDPNFSRLFNPSLNNNAKYQEFINQILATAIYQQNTEAASHDAGQWIFLGRWDGSQWVDRTLVFDSTANPNSLQNRTYQVSQSLGGLNVRSGPAVHGQQAPVIGEINPGASVTLRQVVLSNPGQMGSASSGAGFYWAKINPSVNRNNDNRGNGANRVDG